MYEISTLALQEELPIIYELMVTLGPLLWIPSRLKPIPTEAWMC